MNKYWYSMNDRIIQANGVHKDRVRQKTWIRISDRL